MAIAGDIGSGRHGAPSVRSAGRRHSGSLVAEVTQEARLRAFRVARRHTWLVRLLTLALPLVTLGAFGVYALFLAPSFLIGPGTFKPGKIVVTDDDLKMKNPSYYGSAKDGSKYEVRATEAAVDFAQTGPIRLTGIDGDLTQPSGVVTKLQATRGTLDQKTNQLELYDGVNIDASNGMKAYLKRVMIYTKENRVVSREPVQATMPTGAVRANAMDLSTKDRKVNFKGAVHVSLIQPAEGQPRANVGIGRDTRQPVEVRSDALAVDDTARIADFTGNVTANQGDSILKAGKLHIEYEGRAELPGAQLKGPVDTQPATRLTKLQARTAVILTQGADRRVTSDAADFDTTADTALLTGNVELTQNRNMMRGRRLFVDRRIGRLRLDSPAEAGVPAGRIAATFYQNQAEAKPGLPAKAKVPAAEPVADAGLLQFKTDPNAPIDIESDTLDVADAQRQAVFKGKVKAQQGDMTVQASELHATYAGQTGLVAPATAADDAAQRAGAQITRIEAKGGVLITSKDGREASGGAAVFDLKANTMLMSGLAGAGVTVKDGRQVVVGGKLKMDLTTGMAQFIDDPSIPKTAGPTPVPGGVQATPQGGACPPGRTCVLLFPQDIQDKQKQQKAASPDKKAVTDGWSSSTAPAPAKRAP